MKLLRYVGMLSLFSIAMIALSGCNVDAIGTSNSSLNFERNKAPWPISVWNTNPEMSELTIAVRASAPWILVAPDQVKSKAPEGGVFDEQQIVSAPKSLLHL